MSSNRLLHEQSPYLLQHATNPVDWYPWGPEAFEKAKRDDKPVLLSVGYSTCHWCHVMAHESFEDQDIADLINAHFVSIKVDREERPDIDHIYMAAVSAMTGQGGWPLTAFLTPEGKPFFGGTYFPPEAKWGSPGIKDVLISVRNAWLANRKEILESGEQIAGILLPETGHGRKDQGFDRACLDRACERLSAEFDGRFGGFGTAPKFPMGHTLSFLLHYAARYQTSTGWTMAEKTLDAMAQGGMYDHLGGGFHRYSTDQQWQVPHFEKMLYDQALLVIAYAQAFQSTAKPLYAQTIRETLDYVLRELTSEEGAFFSAQDADSEGREGAFYVWSSREIEEILKADASRFCAYYNVQPGGNAQSDPHGELAGFNILHLTREVAAEDAAELRRAKEQLFQRRLHRQRPHVDDKVLTDWNGLMIAALAYAGAVLNENRYLAAAERSAQFIWQKLSDAQGRLKHRFRDGTCGIEGMLEDYAFLAYGLWHLFQATLDTSFRDKAVLVADRLLELFEDPASGGFFMTLSSSALIVRPKAVYDGSIPSGNSVAAYVLIQLSHLTGQTRYREAAEACFSYFQPVMERAPGAHTFFLTAWDLHGHFPFEISVKDPLAEPGIASFRKVVYKYLIPGLVINRLPSQAPGSFQLCRGGACLPPIQTLDHLETAITAALKE